MNFPLGIRPPSKRHFFHSLNFFLQFLDYLPNNHDHHCRILQNDNPPLCSKRPLTRICGFYQLLHSTSLNSQQKSGYLEELLQ